ncbi:DUF4129 domain-containing protein [Lentisphaera profundi]|uniref:DUF4129 domain-containing protein n=1 Tax=Lentisphaera profundi TaxID=1658616 RepID=A0ABY7W015_9BACT|nr:DUF4129 domain-containing protein [Lentisphaera profundi]WDE98319.1 DUF4129 domain-containing protein [Lentisphaera profundi]
MDLNNLQISLRPRNNWEAFDLGRSLLKKNMKAVYKPWLALTIPYTLVLFLLFRNYPFWGFFTFWFFLPLFERVIIFDLSRLIFGEAPDLKTSLKAFPKELKKGFFSLHFMWRFTFSRSFLMPIWQLEGLKGKSRKKRVQVLSGSSTNSNCSWNGVMYMNIEQLVAAGLLTVCYVLIPVEVKGDIPSKIFDLDSFVYWFEQIPEWLSFFVYIVTALSMILIRPFYVAGGFTLYICRRMVLEGWDIELQFRSLAERIQEKSLLGKKTLSVILLSLCLLFPSNTQAQSNAVEPVSHELETIMAEDEFNEYKKVKSREFKDLDTGFLDWMFDREPDEKPEQESNFDWVSLAGFFKGLFICLMAGALIWLIWKIVVIVIDERKLSKSRIVPKTQAVKFMGMELSEESLPDDISATVKDLLQDGDIRGAISLLYRASVFQLLEAGLRLRSSDTEMDCLRRVESFEEKDTKTFFKELTHIWLKAAYAHKLPEKHLCEALNLRWKSLFEKVNEVKR